LSVFPPYCIIVTAAAVLRISSLYFSYPNTIMIKATNERTRLQWYPILNFYDKKKVRRLVFFLLLLFLMFSSSTALQLCFHNFSNFSLIEPFIFFVPSPTSFALHSLFLSLLSFIFSLGRSRSFFPSASSPLFLFFFPLRFPTASSHLCLAFLFISYSLSFSLFLIAFV